MKVNKRILLVGVILGFVTVFLLNRYIKSLNQDEEVAVTSYVDVVVASSSIPDHVIITENMVAIASIPEEAIHPDALTSLDSVIGGISRTEIINGEQILSARVVTDDMKATLSYKIPDNMRAITIPVNEVSGVANYIAVGDKLDILVSYDMEMKVEEEDQESDNSSGPTTYTQLQNIEVLALGQLKAPSDEERVDQPSTITILVNPEQAEVVAFANMNGSFHLSLRSPIDENINDLDYYNIRNFMTYKER